MKETSTLESIRHDLKNAVTALRIGCGLLEDHLPDVPGSDLREILADMNDQIDRSASLLAQMQELERGRADPPA